MQRAYRDIARDVARATAAPLAQVIVCRPAEPGAPARSAAVDGVALTTREVRDVVGEVLGRDPGHAPALPLLAPDAVRTRITAPCEPAIARALWPGNPGAGRSAFFRLKAEGPLVVLLRVVLAGRIGTAALRGLEAAARLAAAKLESESLRSEVAFRSAAWRAFQESAGEPILVVDPRTGRLLEGNARLCELTGWRRGELRRLRLGSVLEHPILHPDSLLARLAGSPLAREEEARLLRRRGEPVPVSVTAARIDLPDRGPVLHLIAKDVSRERRALADLRQAKDALAALHLAGAHLAGETDEGAVYAVLARELLRLGHHSGVLLPDPSVGGQVFRWRFTSFQPPLQRAIERALGRPLSEVQIDPASAPLVRRCLEEGRTVHTDLARPPVRDLLGGTSTLQIRRLGRLLGLRRIFLAPLRRDGRVVGLLAVAAPRVRAGDPEAIDALALQASTALDKARLFAALREERSRLETEVDRRTRELRLAVAALEAADRRKDAFLANVSHELRTPLVTVLGYADLLLSERLGDLGPRQRSALSVVAQSARRLRVFIDELLDFSRHELTKEALRFGPVDTGDLLAQAVLALAPSFAARGVRVSARTARGTPPIWGDRERLHQVLVNLLSNAERYSPAGAQVRIAAAPAADRRVAVAVTDRGPGIAEEHVGRIFDRLYQVRDDAPGGEGALGLGLAIAKSIVDAHGGAIQVRTRIGRGTRFRVCLPAAEIPAPAEAGAPSAAAGR
jgi:PAS domain S-box-containing protein